MLLEKNFRVPVRVSIAHLDPVLYARLEPGDQIVIYANGIRGTPENLKQWSTEARTLIHMLELRELAYELVDVTFTRIVWEVVRASEIASTHAAE